MIRIELLNVTYKSGKELSDKLEKDLLGFQETAEFLLGKDAEKWTNGNIKFLITFENNEKNNDSNEKTT